MPLGRKVGLDPSETVLNGDPAPPPQKGGRAPQFSTYVFLWPNGAWIKMPLGMEVGLSPRHIMLDGDPAPSPKKGAQPPNFSP